MPVHPEETGRSASPKVASLYLDTDGKYRWYEEGRPTEAQGATLRTAVESARLLWPQFQVIEIEGHAVSTETQAEIPERYAADDLEELDRTA